MGGTFLAATVAAIRERGRVIERSEDFAHGRFARLTDSKGNAVELFEVTALS